MFSVEELSSFRSHLEDIKSSTSLPSEADLQSLLDSSLDTLENEITFYRPKGKDSKPGGLLDFSSSTLPVIVVPDIHGRADFLLNIIDYTLEGAPILSLLNEKKIIVVCVGDAVHSERRGYERWCLAYEAYDGWLESIVNNKSEKFIDKKREEFFEKMREEMCENISSLSIIMSLKNAFPESFHFLKGNHENILNENRDGNYGFRKFVQEGQMCHDFVSRFYGDVILHLWSLWEKSLPVCAVFKDFGVSHAEPLSCFKKEKIIDYHSNADVILGLTWTGNDEAENGSVRLLLKELSPSSKRKGVIWFGGHRAFTDTDYLLRQEGEYLQLHNPDEMNIAIVFPEKKFDPDKDIKSVFKTRY